MTSVSTGFVNYKKGCTRLPAANDKVYQLHAHGRWFSPGSPASSTTKTGRHDLAGILLKVALNTQKKSVLITIQFVCYFKEKNPDSAFIVTYVVMTTSLQVQVRSFLSQC